MVSAIDPDGRRGRVAVLAPAPRGTGRGIADADARVVHIGRSTSANGSARSDCDRPEAIEDAADIISGLGGQGMAMEAHHLDTDDVERLARARFDADTAPGRAKAHADEQQSCLAPTEHPG